MADSPQAEMQIEALDNGKIAFSVSVQGRCIFAAHFTPEEISGLVARLLTEAHEAQVLTGEPPPQPALGVISNAPTCPINSWEFGATNDGRKAVVVRAGRAQLAFLAPDAEIRQLARAMITASSGAHSSLGSGSLVARAFGDFVADLRAVGGVVKARLSASSRRWATRCWSFLSGRSFRAFRVIKFAPNDGFPGYEAVNECIYCGETAYSKKPGVRKYPLGGEHIIAEGLGGTLELPQASCQSCEEATGALVEGSVVGTTLKALRIHLGVKGKKKRPPPTTLPLIGTKDGKKERRIDIDVADYPIIFNMLIYADPKVFKSEDARLPGVVGVTAAVLKYDRKLMRTKYGVTNFTSPVWDTHMLGRMLAKIGYALAFAELGKALFSSTLPALIINGEAEPMKFIGGEPDVPPADAMHELRIGYQRIRGITHVVSKVRLFGSRGGPIYTVVVGSSLETPLARQKRVLSWRLSSIFRASRPANS